MKKEKIGKRIFSSQAQAALAMGYDKAILSRALKAGAPGFESNRVHEEQLAPWLAQHAKSLTKTDKEAAQIEKLNEEIRKLKAKNDRDEGLVVERALVMQADEACCTRVREIIRTKMINESPAFISGLDVAGVRIKQTELGDLLIAEFEKLKEERVKLGL